MTAFWLIATIAGLIIAIYYMAVEGIKQGSMYLVFPLISGMMYGFRTFMTRRMQKEENNNQ
jgi:hypothetical protein